MGEIKSFRDLRIWQQSMQLVLLVYKLTESFLDSEKFGLTSQMRRFAISVPSNIAEDYGRRSTNDYKRFLHISQGPIYELETKLLIAHKLGFLSKEGLNETAVSIVSNSKMTNKLISTLNKSTVHTAS